MAQTKWGIVYGTANPHVRRHIFPDDDSELVNNPLLVGPGEKLITVPIVPGEDNPTFVNRIHQAIATDAGVSQLLDCRFAEIDNTGTVIGIHVGDAALYGGSNTYVNCPTNISIGCTFAAGQFTIPQQILAAKPGVRPTAVTVPAQNVPPGFSTTPIFTATA